MLPAKLPYYFWEWKQLPFNERAKKIWQAWVLQGVGASKFACLFYIIKIAFYLYINEWWFKTEALGKAMHNGKLHWRIYDAKDGLLEEGFGKIDELKQVMPWG